VARHLVNYADFVRLPFAGPLKDMLRVLGLNDRHIDGDLKESPLAILQGKTPRHAMQTLGTEWGRNLIGTNLWATVWMHRFSEAVRKSARGVVVDDVRFETEAELIRSLGGTLWHVHRGEWSDDPHPSEMEMRSIDCGVVIDNTGPIADLLMSVDHLVNPTQGALEKLW
jgi:hypothetical protein